jgi:hypothetical protein
LVVKKRKFKKIITTAEDIAECEYRPVKCKKTYRLIILRKTLDVVRGEMNLFDDVRYFFYITNDRKRSANQMVHFYRGRSDHENDIDQLKKYNVRVYTSQPVLLKSSRTFRIN